jgi:hypothetical protein
VHVCRHFPPAKVGRTRSRPPKQKRKTKQTPQLMKNEKGKVTKETRKNRLNPKNPPKTGQFTSTAKFHYQK